MQTYSCAYVKSCEICAQTKNVTHKPYRLLQPLNIHDHSWHLVSMDFITKLPQSHSYNSIWVICDQMTCTAYFIPICKSMDALELACIYLDHVFHHHSFPKSIISNWGSFLTNLMSLIGRKCAYLLPITLRLMVSQNAQIRLFKLIYELTLHISKMTG